MGMATQLGLIIKKLTWKVEGEMNEMHNIYPCITVNATNLKLILTWLEVREEFDPAALLRVAQEQFHLVPTMQIFK